MVYYHPWGFVQMADYLLGVWDFGKMFHSYVHPTLVLCFWFSFQVGLSSWVGMALPVSPDLSVFLVLGAEYLVYSCQMWVPPLVWCYCHPCGSVSCLWSLHTCGGKDMACLVPLMAQNTLMASRVGSRV